ncbi:MAG: DUF3472 domain-containing protein [Luteolibacter sp.]
MKNPILGWFTATILLAAPVVNAGNYLNVQTSKTNVTDFYEEIQFSTTTNCSYAACNFNGGYVGLAGGVTQANRSVNFSIWDGTNSVASLVEGPDSRLGGSDQHFGNEGTGHKTVLNLRWSTGVRYKLYVRVSYEGTSTIYSAWIHEASSVDWYLCGRIKVTNKTAYIGSPSNFLELFCGGDAERDLFHEAGFGRAWLKNSAGWAPATAMRWQASDPDIRHDSHLSGDGRMVFLTTKNGLVTGLGSPYDYTTLKASPALQPTSPEVSSGRYTLEHNATGKSLAVNGTATSMESTLQNSVKWVFTPTGTNPNPFFLDGAYATPSRLHAKSAENWLLTITDSTWTGTNVQWRTEDAGNGWVYIVHVASGMKLHYNGTNTPTLVAASNTGTNTQWLFRNAE